MTFRTINEDEKKGNREKSNMLEIQKGGTFLQQIFEKETVKKSYEKGSNFLVLNTNR